MSPLHHPSDETLLAHAAGALDEAFRVIVAVHIAACAQCRSLVLRAEQVGGEMLDTLAATAMTGDALDRTLARLDEQGPADRPAAPPPDGLPAALAGYTIGRWRSLFPGVALASILPLERGRAGLHLLRLAPGRALGDHGHGGREMSVVIAGAVTDERGTYGPGDVAERDDEAHHAPVVVGGQTCLCQIADEGRLRFRHWTLRLLQPLIGV